MTSGGYHFTLFSWGQQIKLCLLDCFKWAYFGNGTDIAASIAPTLSGTGILADTSDMSGFLNLFLWQAERHADILVTILARMSASASWNAGLYHASIALCGKKK